VISVQPGFFHAIAVDYDGTIADDDGPQPDVLAALTEMRSAGRSVVLVSGRILSELRKVFPGVDDHVDLIVGENGGVVSRGGTERLLSLPVPRELEVALAERAVGFRRGKVLLACDGQDEAVVLAEVRRLGLECQLVRNRGALMVLPAAVSKGHGLVEGLRDLGISHHNTIAIGDAENDHSLLDVAELGVAVGNAVEALKAHADLVLDLPNGAGVAAFLHGPVVAGRARVHPKRWRIQLGVTADGTPVSVPASQLNMLVAGASRRGKSFVAGLVAERLIGLGYEVLVVDPEGDHVGLGRLRDVLVVGGAAGLPPPEELVHLHGHGLSVILDLSLVSDAERAAYTRAAAPVVQGQRRRTGLPHWVIVDEAHASFGASGAARPFIRPPGTGYCFVTHRPEDLCAEALWSVDVVLVLPGEPDVASFVDLVAGAGAMSFAAAAELVASTDDGQAVLIDRSGPGVGVVTIGARQAPHVRHWHKYSAGRLSSHRRFYFRRSPDVATGVTAGSLEEFERELRRCDVEVIRHHCQGGDFSRWIIDVLGDPVLAAGIAAVEAEVRTGRSAGAARDRVLQAIHERHPG
jgi:hydroxymethylpyrimidine pyrophosphatase-like HAD family hydrolase